MNDEETLDDLFEGVDTDTDEIGDKGALALLGRLCSKSRDFTQMVKYERLRDNLNNRLPDILSSGGLNDPSLREIFAGVEHLGAAIMENIRLPMLRNKTIVGVGGGFSAGKSRFLNSLTNMEQLKEDQGPTTAIGTYLIHGDKFSIQAHTKNNKLEPLSSEELKSVSHKFYDSYQIGFADVLHKLIITSPDFRDDLILLDTPGYSKDDNDKALEETDRRIARDHLKNSDFIIWLIDIAQGTIIDSDLKFLKDLQMKNPCLIVLNKADQKSNSEIQSTLESTEKMVRRDALPCYGITAYSSYDKREYQDKGIISKYLDKCAKADTFSAMRELGAIRRVWSESFARGKRDLDAVLAAIEKSIGKSVDITHIQGLLTSYASMTAESTQIYYDEMNFSNDMDKFIKPLSDYIQE